MGKCETWMSSLVGRKLLYPRDFGMVTAGANNTTHVGVSYNSLRIQGYAYGAHGLNDHLTKDPDDCIFPNVDLSTSFGAKIKTQSKIPLMTGALGLHLYRGKILGCLRNRRGACGDTRGHRRKCGGGWTKSR